MSQPSPSYVPFSGCDCGYLGDDSGPCWGDVEPVDELPSGDGDWQWVYACAGHRHTWERRAHGYADEPDYIPEETT